MKFPKVSIIIPLYIIEDRFFKDLKNFDKLDYPDFEILLVSDIEIKIPKLKSKVRTVLTGRSQTGPAEKRDIAMNKAKGKICAFIDDDAYPDRNWIKNAVKWFNNDNVVGVGGPGITPKEDGYWEKIGGSIIESFLCSGGVQYRYLPTQKAFVDDYPAYNLFVKIDILKKVKGYNCNFYGGEDTFLCMKLMKYGDIVYDPKVLVYHHRRAFPQKHMTQIGNVGLHRGYFFRKYPETSRRLFYLLPTILTFGLFTLSVLAVFKTSIFLPILLVLFLLFWLLGTISVVRRGMHTLGAMVSGLGIIVTHITYAIYFLKGLATAKLDR
jgi:glycosyltransferase involved in cell wall biosynthesis